MALHRWNIAQAFDAFIGRPEIIRAMGRRMKTGHDTDAGRRAHWDDAMGVGEVAPTCRQLIHMRSQHIWVSTQQPNPIIEIIDTNHLDIGPSRFRLSRPDADAKDK